MENLKVGDTVHFVNNSGENFFSEKPFIIDSISIVGDCVKISDKEEINVCYIPLIEGCQDTLKKI